MSILATLEAARVAAEAIMLAECVVSRGSGSTYDSGTGRYTPTPTTIYTGKCRVQMRALVVSEADAGDTEHGVIRWEIHLPIEGTETVQRNDTVTITASQSDSSLVGRVFTVSGPHAKTLASARRIPVSALVDEAAS